MIYLASPYSYVGDADELTQKQHRELRYRQTLFVQTQLFNFGYPVFSTIAHTHVTALAYKLPHDAAYWMRYNHHMIDLSRAVFVLQLPGWEASIGVTDEIQYANKQAIPVYPILVNSSDDGLLDLDIPIVPELQTLTKFRNPATFVKALDPAAS